MDAFEQMTRRRRGSGLLLLVFVIALLAYPLWRTRGIDHPLAGELHLDVCAMLPPPALPSAAKAHPVDSNGNLACIYRDDDPSQPNLFIASLMTTRAMSADEPANLRRAFETWTRETKASGAQAMRDEPGPWATAASWRMGKENVFLFEDHGVMLSLQSTAMTAADLAYYARHAAELLRTAKPVRVSSSPAVATPAG
jgi:hypothetical protein